MGADKRVFSKVTDSRAVEYYLEDVEGEEDPLGDVRNFLYPEEEDDDEKLVDVSHAESVDAVFKALGRDTGQWSHKHTTQAIATLFHLQKRCGHPESKERHCASVKDFAGVMNEEDNFDRLLSRLGEHYREVDLRKLAYCFMCLRRLTASSESPVCARVLRDVQILLSRSFDSMDLTTLSYFAVGLRDRNMIDSKVRSTSLTWGLALAPAMPAIEKFVEAAETPEDLRQLAICINAASRIASFSIMDKFAAKVMERLEKILIPKTFIRNV